MQPRASRAMTATGAARIALVGAGRMGRVHLHALQLAAGAEAAAIVEPYEPARSQLAREGMLVYESVGALLERSADIDGVLIAAPSDQHAELVRTFASAGLAVLCEKPVGVRAVDALAATGAALDAAIPFQVGYWRRFVPELRALRERIAAGELGEIFQISCMQWDQEPPSAQFRAHSGGIVIDMGVHEFDQARWLLGQELVSLSGVGAGRAGSDPGRASSDGVAATDPDAAVILARLSGGAVATISLGRHFPHEDSCWVEVWGSRGYERVPFMWDTGGEAVFLSAMVAQVEAFARLIGGDEREGAAGEDAVAALRAAEQASDALAAGAVSTASPVSTR